VRIHLGVIPQQFATPVRFSGEARARSLADFLSLCAGGSGHNADANLEEAARSALFLPFVERGRTRVSGAHNLFARYKSDSSHTLHSPVTTTPTMIIIISAGRSNACF